MANPWEEYQPAPASGAAPWEEYGGAAAVQKAPLSLKGDGFDKAVNYSGRNAVGGQIRGAGSIGSTLVSPFESAAENEQRRTAIDQGLTSLIGSDPNATAYKTNKLIAEAAGTSGVGGGIAGLVSKIPGALKALPSLLPAIRTGGMTAGGATGVGGLATRAAGGAVTGAATAGAVNPGDAAGGALIGGAFPVAARGVADAFGSAGKSLRVAGPNPTMLQTAKDSINAGYVIPPNMVRPSFGNQVIESISGKQATQQIASMKNTAVTEGLVRQALGIADDIPLTQSTMEDLRKTAGKAYADVSSLSPAAAADLEALKVARNESQGWFKAYNRSARPDDLAQAKQFKAQADTLEAALEGHAQAAGRNSLIPDLRQARKAIAKTYTVGRALNDASGTVDARVLGRMYEKGSPLSDGLDTAGKFASAFPTIAKSPQQVGSPAAHNLKAMGSAVLGGGGYAALGPFGAVAGMAPFVAPPVARAMMFREGAQKKLLTDPNGQKALQGLLEQPVMYRSAGLLAGY